jgi:hypothetical protein
LTTVRTGRFGGGAGRGFFLAGGRTGAERLERAAGAALKTIWETGAAADATGPVSEDRRKFFFTLTSAVASGVLAVTYAALFRCLGLGRRASLLWATDGVFRMPSWYYGTSTFDDSLGSAAVVLAVAIALGCRLCPKCKEPYEVDDELAARHGLTPGEVFYRPKGCLHCRRLGYRGRIGVFEVIRMTPRLTRLIQKRIPLDQLRKGAREEGMKMLYDSALDKVRQGLTSLEAALSVTMAEEE